MNPGVMFEIQMLLAEEDLSAGWVYGVLAMQPWQVAVMDDRAARDVWDENDATLLSSSLMPGGRATAAAGGYRIGGRWKYSSGCCHADWIFLGGVLPASGSAPPERAVFLVPRGDFEVVDTWDVTGLRGTGSHDIVVRDAFVPGYRVQTILDNFNRIGVGQAINTGALYRMPYGQILFRGVSTGLIGALEGMLRKFIEFSRDRVAAGGRKVAEDPVLQLLCAETAAAIDEMKTILRRNFRHLAECAERGEMPDLALRMRYKFQSAWAAETCALLAARIYKAAGAAGSSTALPFARILADINTGRQHMSNQVELAGLNWGAAMTAVGENTDFLI
jgi:3-hydroxy-9,10-secoandrosta-1,3,5(10)-triene-9,17-dione monooxygenase